MIRNQPLRCLASEQRLGGDEGARMASSNEAARRGRRARSRHGRMNEEQRRSVPSGTVTMLFTDIEGSTLLVRELRERYESVLGTHRRLLRAAVEEGGGYEVDTQGDAFFFVFPRAR